jgi:NADH-quinone oxidoreductase subunit G
MVGMRIPRKSFRETGRTAVTAHVQLHEPKPPADADSPLAFTMEGRLTQPPPSLITRFWAPGWNSDQSLNKFQIEVGGALRGGDPGVRLIEPSNGSSGRYFPGRAAPAAQAPGTLTLVPRYHVFGSEELSILSRGVAQRVPAVCIAMSSDDARALGLSEGSRARVTPSGSGTVELPVVIRSLPAGVASVPWGVPGMPLRALPASARVAGGGA